MLLLVFNKPFTCFTKLNTIWYDLVACKCSQHCEIPRVNPTVATQYDSGQAKAEQPLVLVGSGAFVLFSHSVDTVLVLGFNWVAKQELTRNHMT